MKEAMSDRLRSLGLCRIADRLSMQLPINERSGGEVRKERLAAAQLRDLIREDRRARVPEATKAAKEAFDKRLPISARFGWHASWLGREELKQRAYGSERNPLDVHEKWFERAMPSTGTR